MKKILLLFILAPLFLFSQSFGVLQIKVSDASMKNDYEKYEAMWANAHEEIHKKGNKVGWFFFKVVPNSNNPDNQKADFDYVILNFYKDDEARKAGLGVELNDAFIKKANYGKMKSSEVRRLLSLGNGKIKREFKNYQMTGLDATIDTGGDAKIGNRVRYIGVKALNDDYENYEMKWFKNGHNQEILSGRRLAWYFNKVLSSSDNADKSLTHAIFERFNPTISTQTQQTEATFEQEMMWKHGGASREFIEYCTLELINFRSAM
jgi:hypothetical protein